MIPLLAAIKSPTGRATLGLGVTQIVGWGTTFLMPSVLGRHVQDELGLPSEIVFAGITVMFGVGAVIAPRIGRVMDRIGARLVMSLGSLVYAVALVALANSQGLASYLGSWALLGIASALALNTPSSIAIVQVAGPQARQAIALLAILGGLASTVFWPLTGALDVALGWRGTLLVYAAVHLLLCAPVHFLVLPGRVVATATTAGGAAPAPTGIEPEHRKRAFLLLAITLSFGAFVFTGAIVHMIEILRGLGYTTATAVLLATMVGPAQVAIRLVELLFGHRYSIMNAAVFGSAALPLGLALMLIAGDQFIAALVGILCYGLANGLKAVQRATLPLALFGRSHFGAYMGRLALPGGIVSASAPPLMAAILTNWGSMGALWICFGFGTVSLGGMILLARLGKAIR